MASLRLQSLMVIAALILVFTLTSAEIRFTEIRSDSRSTIPLHEFGFTPFGRLHLNLSQISFSLPEPADLSRIGFLLCTTDSWNYVIDQISCPLDSPAVKPVVTFNHTTTTTSYDTVLNVTDTNHFSLVFANCAGANVKVSFNLISVMYNVNPKNNARDYLSVGKSSLPTIYLMFFLAYVCLSELWVKILHRRRAAVSGIHFFMLAVLFLKAQNLLCDYEVKSYIQRSGTPHGWDVLFYSFSFIKTFTLFIMSVLIGTGWTFLKPYLQDRDKKVLIIVVSLKVVANLAKLVGPFGQDTCWRQALLLVDIICCWAVLFPMIWSIRNMREAAMTDVKTYVNLMKLKLFRRYYVTVICYIYFTRVMVYVLETITTYRYAWTSVLATELGTLAFYVFTGYTFMPKSHDPYFVVADESLKLEDELE